MISCRFWSSWPRLSLRLKPRGCSFLGQWAYNMSSATSSQCSRGSATGTYWRGGCKRIHPDSNADLNVIYLPDSMTDHPQCDTHWHDRLSIRLLTSLMAFAGVKAPAFRNGCVYYWRTASFPIEESWFLYMYIIYKGYIYLRIGRMYIKDTCILYINDTCIL